MKFDTDTQVAMAFHSTEELDDAIDWLWSKPELRNLPRVHVGRNTMIVPEKYVKHFTKKGFAFDLGRVISAGDLSADEINRVRRGEKLKYDR